MRTRSLAAIPLLAFATLTSCGDDSTGPVVIQADLLHQCLVPNTAGWFLTRGFYTDSFPGTRVGRIELNVTSDVAGDYSLRLTLRRDAYNGTALGSDTTLVTMDGNVGTFYVATFEFPNRSMPLGDTVTFDFEALSGPGTAYSRGGDDAACNVRRTVAKVPPLDTDHGTFPNIVILGTP